MPLPRSQTGVGLCPSTGSITLGSSFPLRFDGSVSFSLGLWVQAPGDTPTATLLQAANAFALTVDQGQLQFSFTSQISPLVGQFPLVDNEWHYITIVYAASQPYAGVLTMFYDGVASGTAAVSNLTPNTTNGPLVVGGDGALGVWCVQVYSVALAAGDAGCDWTPDAASPSGLVASFCFMQNPPMDSGPNNYAIAFNGGASEQIVTPGVSLTVNASATPPQNEGVSPGGGTTPYTLQAWIYATDNTAAATVFSNGNLDQSAFTLGVAPSGSGLSVTATRGGQTYSAGSFPLNEWHNVAAAYDGTTLSLYLDGVLVGSTASGTAAAPAASTLSIGAACNSNGILSNWFHGWIQCVDVWTTCLAAADIATYQDTAPYGQTGCVAIYDFCGNAANGVTGASVSLQNGAMLSQFTMAPPSDFAEQAARAAASIARVHPAIPPGPLETPRAAAPLDDAAVARIIGKFDEMLDPAVDEATRTAARRIFADGVQQAQQWLRENRRPLPGSLTRERDANGEVVFKYHTTEGAAIVYRLPATTDDCLTWYILVVATTILGLLTLFGVSIAPGRVVAAITRRFRNTPVLRSIVLALVEDVSGRTMVQVARAIFNLVAIHEFFSDVFSNLRWYEILFIVAAVAFQLIEIMFPNPTMAAFVAIKLATLGAIIVQLQITIADRPQGCI